MADPTPYSRTQSFRAFQDAEENARQLGTRLDVEFDHVAGRSQELADRVNAITNHTPITGEPGTDVRWQDGRLVIPRGDAGRDGTDGRDGIDGRDGTDGEPGPGTEEAIEAKEIAEQAAEEVELVKQPPYSPFLDRAQAEGTHVPPSVQQINIMGVQYIRDSDGTALQTADGAMWSPIPDNGGMVPLEAWGVVYGDRSAAAANGLAINRALVFCAAHGVGLYLGAGTIFNSVPIVQSGRVSVRGAGSMDEWAKLMTPSQGRATTTIVMVGQGSKDQTVFGVSSMHNWGAGRINPSARTATHNDAEYRLLSFVNDSASASDRSLKPFSVAWMLEMGAKGSRLSGFRILPDYGGEDGMQGYTEEYNTVVGVVSYPLTSGDWDIGLMLDNTREVICDNMQVVGQWRMAGLFATAHKKQNPAGLYKNYFNDCTFTGYHGVEIRAFDGAPVVSQTANSVDIPWADDHPFGADGDNRIMLTNGPWPQPNGDRYTFSGMEKITSGSYPVLRLTGITPAVPGGIIHAYPLAYGGGTSHTLFNGGEISSFHHPSREPCHIKGLAGEADGVFKYPGGCLFISGTKATEIELNQVSMSSYEEVAVHIHDCRMFSFDGYVEMNRGVAGGSSRGGRVIMSPNRRDNPHSLTGFSTAETLNPIWVHRGSTLIDGSLDTRPNLPYIGNTSFLDPSDRGFMEAVYLKAPLDPTTNGNQDEGQALIAIPGGRAGLGRRLGPPSFNNPDPGGIDWGMFYFDRNDVMVLRKPMLGNSAGAEGINPGFDGTYAGIGINPIGYFSASINGPAGYWDRRSDGILHRFSRGGLVGSISVDGVSTTYNTSSDYRLKVDAAEPLGFSASDQLIELANRLRWYSWKSKPDQVDLGWFAHELAEVAPCAVTGEKDAVNADGDPEYQGRDDSKLIPVIVAALGNALKRIAELEAKEG